MNARLFDPEACGPRAGALLVQEGRIAGRPSPDGGRVHRRGARRPRAALGSLRGFWTCIFTAPSRLPEAMTQLPVLSRQAHPSCVTGPQAFSRRPWRCLAPSSTTCSRRSRPWSQGARGRGRSLSGSISKVPGSLPERPERSLAGAIRPADPREVDEVITQGAGTLRMVTLAPEVPGAAALLAALSRARIVAALGHSLASQARLRPPSTQACVT